MASAVRLTPPPLTPVHIVGTGPFGKRCGQLLAANLPASRRYDSIELTAAFASQPAAVVLAIWRPEPALCEAADEIAFRYGVPWLPVIMEHPAIRVGPVIRPPAGPCFGCYARRRGQHDGQPWATAALHAAYQRDRTCGPRGYLPQHARLAAGVAQTMLLSEAGSAADAVSATVTTIRLVTGGMSASRVMACHGCARCGGGVPPGPPGWMSELSLQLRPATDDPAADRGHRPVGAR